MKVLKKGFDTLYKDTLNTSDNFNKLEILRRFWKSIRIS